MSSLTFYALDFPSPLQALELAGRLDPALCRVKVGKELFTRAGPQIVSELNGLGFQVFLDLKFHDIPNTVAGACRAAAELGVWMLNVHAFGGPEMMDAARRALDESSPGPILIAVTVLTSLDEGNLRTIGVAGAPRESVVRLARLAADCGLDGVVCSAEELVDLRHTMGSDFLLVTPGIRPGGVAHGDQRRVATPEEASMRGADYLVIGRPVTAARDPGEALRAIDASLRTTGS